MRVDSTVKIVALAEAVTFASQPLSRELVSFATLSYVVELLSSLVMPTEYSNSCASVDVIPFQKPVALPALFFKILIECRPPFFASYKTELVTG